MVTNKSIAIRLGVVRGWNAKSAATTWYQYYLNVKLKTFFEIFFDDRFFQARGISFSHVIVKAFSRFFNVSVFLHDSKLYDFYSTLPSKKAVRRYYKKFHVFYNRRFKKSSFTFNKKFFKLNRRRVLFGRTVRKFRKTKRFFNLKNRKAISKKVNKKYRSKIFKIKFFKKVKIKRRTINRAVRKLSRLLKKKKYIYKSRALKVKIKKNKAFSIRFLRFKRLRKWILKRKKYYSKKLKLVKPSRLFNRRRKNRRKLIVEKNKIYKLYRFIRPHHTLKVAEPVISSKIKRKRFTIKKYLKFNYIFFRRCANVLFRYSRKKRKKVKKFRRKNRFKINFKRKSRSARKKFKGKGKRNWQAFESRSRIQIRRGFYFVKKFRKYTRLFGKRPRKIFDHKVVPRSRRYLLQVKRGAILKNAYRSFYRSYKVERRKLARILKIKKNYTRKKLIQKLFNFVKSRLLENQNDSQSRARYASLVKRLYFYLKKLSVKQFKRTRIGILKWLNFNARLKTLVSSAVREAKNSYKPRRPRWISKWRWWQMKKFPWIFDSTGRYIRRLRNRNSYWKKPYKPGSHFKFNNFKIRQNKQSRYNRRKRFKKYNRFFRRGFPYKTNKKNFERFVFFNQYSAYASKHFIRYNFYHFLAKVISAQIYMVTGLIIRISFNFFPLYRAKSNFFLNYITAKLHYRYKLADIIKPIVRISRKLYRGLVIRCSGRFTRAQIAVTKKFVRRPVSYSRITSNLDYSQRQVVLKYGVCNLKVWIRS